MKRLVYNLRPQKKDGVSQPAICFVLNYSDLNQRNNKLVDVGFFRKAYYKCK